MKLTAHLARMFRTPGPAQNNSSRAAAFPVAPRQAKGSGAPTLKLLTVLAALTGLLALAASPPSPPAPP